MSISETQVNRELLLSFFLTFSRFEYALKACGFYHRRNLIGLDTPRIYDAKPDWDRFAISLRSSFQIDRDDELRQACDYILNSPPNKQVIVNNSVAWETPVRPDHESDIVFLLRMVRYIRNNLFHGGKHSAQVHESIERTDQLLNSSLVVLKEYLILAPDLKRSFEEATI